MSLDLIIGPMFSGKTTELIRRLIKFASIGKKCLYVNSSIDTRESTNFSTHNPTITKLNNIESVKIDDINNLFIEGISQYDIIGIDESQLFNSNLKHHILQFVEEYDKHVIMSGLNGDFLRNKFGSILDLVPYCDNITKLSAYCAYCAEKGIIKDAHFSKRKDVSITDVIEISYKSYIPVCRKCYKN
tara:strand:- start:367 stop:927 length:561 start_codon:yes stop_codon:yes gene_type:complete